MNPDAGTGDGNRTRVSCLGSARSAIELHPQRAFRGRIEPDNPAESRVFPVFNVCEIISEKGEKRLARGSFRRF